LIFDVGDVLYDGSLWRRWLLQLLARMNVHMSYAQFYREWEQQYSTQACLGHADYWQVLREYLTDQGLCEGQADEVCRAASTREKRGENQPRTFRGVARTLGMLRASGYRLAALSNTELEECQLRRKLARMGLDSFFGVVVSSRNSGAVKPQPEAYQAAMDTWPLAPHEIAFVGHDADELHGAAQCGLATIALFHEPHVAADWRIDDFADLSQLLGTPQLRAA
jgi:FMN phosphatase YigB (HAD superfamily)